MFEMITAPKKVQEYKSEFMRYRGYHLEEVYGRCSDAKKRAWQHYKMVCNNMNGESFHITAASSNFFTVMWAATSRKEDGTVYEFLFRATGKSETFVCYPMV